MRFIDLTGQRFGRLIVIERAPNARKETRWTCRCDCGRTTIAFAQNLRRGLTQSCNCLRSEINSAAFSADLAGQHFGCLTAVDRAPDYVAPNGARHVRWNCVCDCDRAAVASANDLRSGHTTTCGCRRFERLLDLEHVLYRLYDADDVLLYVGMTNEWDRRESEHARFQPWWGEVVRFTHEPYPNRVDAEAAEKVAVRTEHPVFNKVRYHEAVA